jgi:hypothetical protein
VPARRLTYHLPIGTFLIAALMLNGLFGLSPALMPMHAQNQNRIIIINADQPNVWTLEQAHYLLAQMHRRNLDLRTKNLEELDPNEIAGLRFDVLRTLIELGVSYDDANRVSNRMLRRNMNFNTARREELITRRQRLRDESLTLTREIGNLQAAKAAATTEDERNRLDEEIAAKTTVRGEVDKEVQFVDQELGTITAPSGEFQRTEAEAEFDSEKLPESIFDESFKKAAGTMIERFNQQPRLNASLRLENFLQMQYEIIAKQLTLLRDEVGPGERLLFLELPQTVNVTHHEADNKWAQSWWRIVGYMRNKKLQDEKLRDRSDLTSRSADRKNQEPNQERPEATSNKIRKALEVFGGSQDTRTHGDDQYVNLESQQAAKVPVWIGTGEKEVPITDQTVRTVELIPRQSSLNVNDLKLRVRSGAFTAVANFLFGFGTRLNVQRQREQFSQFVQQELYSSAFGKGSREFGWTLTPMPGTERLLPGVRTTYAVVVVPNEATSLVLQANGCYFPRDAYQPNDFNDTLSGSRWHANRTSRNCGESEAFIVPIPVGGSGRNDFFADRIFYRTVDKGERIVVSVQGYNFSAQTGVLINGSPLTHAIGLAQPLIRDDSITGARTAEDLKGEKVRGRIERIDSEQIVFSFEMPANFTGTPTITLVAPGKSIDLNGLSMQINGHGSTTLNALLTTNPADPMFRLDPDPDVQIDGIEAFRSPDGRLVRVVVSGKGFAATQPIFVNGVRVPPNAVVSSTLLRAEIPATEDETMQLVLSADNSTVKSKAVSNPAHLRINNVTLVSYEPATRLSPVAVLIVKLEGSGFSEWLAPSVGNLTQVSSSEALLQIENPAAVTPLVLRDQRTGFTARTVITRSRVRRVGSP